MKKFISIIALLFIGFCLQAQLVSDVVILGGKTSDTASYRGTTAYPWTSSSFYASNKPVYYKFHLDLDTLGGLARKAKYYVDVEELLAGTTWYRVSRTNWGSSAGWTGVDTNFVLTNMSAVTDPPLITKYYRVKITPRDSIQNIRVAGYLIRWNPTK